MEHWFSKCYLFHEFQIKYFKDIEILYEKLFLINKYCPISYNEINTVFTDMNNVESISDIDSSNERDNINNNSNRNNIINNSNISDSENININIRNSEYNSIATNNVVNSSIYESRVNISSFLNNKCVNIYVMWYPLYNFLLNGRGDADIIKRNGMLCLRIKSFLVIILKRHSWYDLQLSFTEILPRASTRQGLQFRKYKLKPTNCVNADNAVRQAGKKSMPMKEKTIISFR